MNVVRGLWWLVLLVATLLVAFGLLRRAFLWLVLALFALDILVIFVWWHVGGNQGAFS